MNVRKKNEIISVGLDHIRPAEMTRKEIEPTDFKSMLDAGKPVHVLDTRNDYELRVGTFENAIDLNIRTFRAFPEAIQRLPASMKDEPVVMFCTGGIRCEKASAIMMEAVYQREATQGGCSGILRTLAETIGTVTASCLTSACRGESLAQGNGRCRVLCLPRTAFLRGTNLA